METKIPLSRDAVQQELLDQAELLSLTLEATQAGIWDYRPETGTNFLSRQWFDMLGYPAVEKEVNAAEMERFIHPDDLPVVLETLRNYLKSYPQGLFETEMRLRRANGTWCWVLSKGRTVAWDEKGRSVRIIGLDFNIEKTKDASLKLARNEVRFRAIFDNAPFPATVSGIEDRRIIEANKAFFKTRGISREALSELRTESFTKLSDDERANLIARLMMQGSVEGIEIPIIRPDGTEGHAMVSSTLLDIEDRKQVLTVAADISKQKEAEKALRASETFLRTLIDTLPDLIWLKDTQGRYLACNKRFERFFGAPEADIIGKTDYDFLDKNQAEFFREKDAAAVAAGKPCIDEEEITYRDDGHNESLETIKTPMYDAEGKLMGVLSVARDITERKQSEKERQKLQDQFFRAQKLEAVGILAGGVAHDFNNMLGAIIGHTEMLMQDLAATAPMRHGLAEILDAAKRSANLTNQLLVFARKQKPAPVHFELNEAVEAILKMLRRLIGENITLVWRPGNGRFTVDMDPSHLDQVLANLCVNASDAISDVGRIIIRTDTCSFDESICNQHTDCLPGQYVKLSISDSGCGMDKETQQHLFEPFFTTKPVGRGTGLGLATVYGIVKQSRGFIQVESEPDQGTTFNIFLPRQAETLQAMVNGTAMTIPRGRGETILLVEDSDFLLQMGQMLLQRLGYTVLSTNSPTEAIRLTKQADTALQLVISDVVMPEMNGRELVERLLAMRPDLRYLYMSGYTADIVAPSGVSDQGAHFIQKPFSIQDIAVKVRALLDRPGP